MGKFFGKLIVNVKKVCFFNPSILMIYFTYKDNWYGSKNKLPYQNVTMLPDQEKYDNQYHVDKWRLNWYNKMISHYNEIQTYGKKVSHHNETIYVMK